MLGVHLRINTREEIDALVAGIQKVQEILG
jgi:hypothetical protein